jgi:acetyl-CoA carboxylase biotin carboxyl carrier protein
VKALVDALDGTDVTTLVWARSGHKVVIRRGQAAPAAIHAAAPAMPAAAPVLHAAPAAPAPAAPRAEKPEKPGALVTSPFVGTFYRAPSPESPPYVDVGAKVKKGQVLCIVEAMKLMNEIEAEVEGTVAEILVANATPVEFGQPLFRIEPA